MKAEELEGCSLKAGGQVIGLIASYTEFLSIYNKYGRHGTSYSQTSIFNKYCKYGGITGSHSPFNVTSKTPPQIVDKFGHVVAYLTVNPQFPKRVDPGELDLGPDGIIPSEANEDEQAR